jgi:hypothetical protein
MMIVDVLSCKEGANKIQTIHYVNVGRLIGM